MAFNNPSFSRIFERIIIDNIKDNDVEDFFRTIFDKERMSFDDKSLKLMVDYTYGMPLVMQQIGDSVFWLSEDNKINEQIVSNAIIWVAIQLGEKQIRSTLNKIRSKYYESILIKICYDGKMQFKKSDVVKYLNKDEKKVFTDCLSRVKDLGIIESIGWENSGEYEFSNRLYFVYFLILSKIKEFKDNIYELYNDDLAKGLISQEKYDDLIYDLEKTVEDIFI